jgi:amino acid adenylation domain-containing protein
MNLYGATETTLAKTWYVIPDDPQPGVQPIGQPMPETQVLILGRGNRPCGVREPGQIAIRTPFMSSGYINGGAVDKARFIQNPFREDPSDQVYLTGDVGYVDSEGLLRILGRLDDQIKLRGVRIEPAEIAAQLEQHADVRQAFVSVQEADDGERMLVAYIVFDGGQSTVMVPEIRAYLRGLLPEYLMPGAFVAMETLPLTANGKVDRRALPKPELSRSSLTVSFDPPRNPMEETIAGIWKTILKLDAVGRQDNFFDLGGHSLLATRVIARMRRELSENISLRALFEHPTIESLARAVGGEGEEAESNITKKTHEKTMPVSFAQQRLWFLDKFKGSSSEYNVAGAMRLKGRLNVDALKKALQGLIDRHESLRTRFLEQAGEPFQVVEPSYQFEIEFEDLSAEVEGLKEDRLQETVDVFCSHSFDLKKVPLFTTKLVRIGDDDHILLRNIHHIISDGWSQGIFNRELSTLYGAYVSGTDCDLEPLSIQYSDFAKWQRESLSGSHLESQVLYWREQLKATPSLDLPTDYPRPLRQTYAGAHQGLEIPEAVVERLNTFNKQERVTPFMTLMAAFNAVLSRYSGETDITIGTPVANRQRVEHEDLIGFFVNTLPVRTDMSGNPDFRNLVQRVREVVLDAFAHQDLPFEKVVEVLNPERDMGRHPIFQIVFSVQNAPRDALRFPGLEVSPFPIKSDTTHFDLEFHLMPLDGRWTGTIVYNTDLFLPGTISRLKTHFVNLLTSCLEHPDTPVDRVAMLAPEERKQLLVDWNQTDTDYPRKACIHEVFREQAARAPEAVALVQDDRQLTYCELDAWSDRVARRLIRDGAKAGDRVGVCLDRSPELVAAFLGILKAGCAYVPLARDYPVDRLTFMLEDAGLKTVIADSGWPEGLQNESVQVIDCSENTTSTDDEGQPAPQVGVAATDAAYVIYTSGSTGRPKGTVIPHRGVVRLVKGQDYADFGPEQRYLLLASPSFDASTFEIWAPLLNGGSAAIYADRFVDPPVLEEVLRKHGVTCLWLTTGLFNLIVDTAPAILGLVRHVLTGGELLSIGHVEKARAIHPDLRLTNFYGPTECTTFATFNELCTRQGELPTASIGKPIAHTQAYILDSARQPVPVGVAGELYLGGDGLSTGYLNQPELTNERFVANPFTDIPGDRLYRTGDICRYLPDGRIDFIGRVDNQVKVRGFRVETGEIESVLNQHPSIQKGAIRVSRDSTGIVNLVAYFVPRPDRPQPAKSEVKAFLSARLPDYAVPSAFESVPAFPLTSNGKVEFASLPEPGLSRGSAEQTETRREDFPVESQLIALWEKLFQRPGIKRDDNFFNLGGHSLMAARLASEIESYFGRTIPIAALFEAPTVEQLAARLKDHDESDRPQCLVTLQPEGSKMPLFCIHGWGGEVFGFLDLARELAPERPVYGLQAIGLDGKVPRHASVEEMAAYYAEEISNFHPEGPVHLIGYSAGGWIAYAVAQDLLLRGRTVNLSMLDTGMSSKIPYWLYAATKTIHLFGRLPHHIRFWCGLPRKEKWAYFPGRLRWLRVNLLRDITLLLKNRAEGDSEPAQDEDKSKDAEAFQMDYFILLAGNYRPKPYAGDLTLFAAKGSRWYSRIFWKFMIRGSINIHFVDGGHHGLIDKYHVGNFSILFKEVLDCLDHG